MIRLGLQIPIFTFPDVPDAALFEQVASIATTAERAGFDSVWVMDHFYQLALSGLPPEDPMLEAYTLLGAIAARTERVQLGTLVTGVTYRNPALLAKTVTTLDVISSGRAVLGIGAAWYEAEHQGYGFTFPPVRERMDRLDEALRICRTMFTRERSTYEGRYYRVQDALNFPRPIRPGGPPILVSGAGERRTLRLVARHADIWNFPTRPALADIPHLLATLERHCAAEDRDPATIAKTALRTLVIASTQAEAERRADQMRARMGLDEASFRGRVLAGGPAAVAEQAQAYLDAGLDGLIVNMLDARDPESVALAGEALCFLRESNTPGRSQSVPRAAAPGPAHA
jgi:F420-dependent oxidoreductase-like protein